jgi:protoporphyrinogen oxidase
MKKIVIIGAGPAGMGLAVNLARRPDLKAEILLLEQETHVGGITASFEYAGLHLDHGSHRLHPATPGYLLEEIRTLLGADLREHARKGRIRLKGRFVRFPLHPPDLIRRLPPSLLLGIGRDMLARTLRPRTAEQVSFAQVLLDALGPSLCHAFYFPYAQKLWGRPPQEIAAAQAHRRVSATGPAQMVRKVLQGLPGLKGNRAGRFFYPKQGFGRITRSMADTFERLGGKILFSTSVRGIGSGTGQGLEILTHHQAKAPGTDSRSRRLTADQVFSTLPLTQLLDMLRTETPRDVMEAGRSLSYRSMVLCYLILETDRFTPFDAHYFPENEVRLSRLSEPKNYSGCRKPKGLTALCAEIPCWAGERVWKATDDELRDEVLGDLDRAGLPVRCLVKAAFAKRITHAYPVCDLEYEKNLSALETYLQKIPGLVSLGRQGLFIHDNIHHAFQMAHAASACLRSDGTWDASQWRRKRAAFDRFTVED